MQMSITEESGVPIYQQIVDDISARIQSGSLLPGQQLPTVRELASQTGVSRGTIKHAYDCLGQLGLVDMTQGRGTFIRGPQSWDMSAKDQAMTAIDQMLDKLEQLSFTAQEMRIFFDLKLREREDDYLSIQVGVVDCSPESLAVICRQLSVLPRVEVQRFLLEDVLESPQLLRGNLDLVVTTATHFAALEDKVPGRTKLMRVVLSVASGTVLALGRLAGAKEAGIACKSLSYANIIRKSCGQFSQLDRMPDVYLLGSAQELEEYLSRKEILILPSGYHPSASSKEAKALEHFVAGGGEIIRFENQVDRGSFIYVEEQIGKLMRAGGEESEYN